MLALEHGDGEATDLGSGAGAAAGPRPWRRDFGRLAVALPSCEALSAGTVEERRAIIATLVRRGDADAVALLRWALGASDPDLAVDAALALEEMTASFDARLAACRDALARGREAGGRRRRPHRRAPTAALPPAEAALAAAELITHAIDVGIADPALVPALASEAREDYALAGGGRRARRRGRDRADAARAGRAAPGHRARLHRRRAAGRRRRGAPDACSRCARRRCSRRTRCPGKGRRRWPATRSARTRTRAGRRR